MLIRSKPRQLVNFVRFMTCGREKDSDKCDKCEKIQETEYEKKEFCKKDNNCDDDDNDNSGENQENWRTKFCKTPKKFSTSPLSEIDLSDPCGKQCRPPPSPPPQQPKESCFCYEDIELCPPTEEIRARHKMWRFASFFVFPIIGLALSFILPAHRKSQEELEEKIQNSEYVPYPYMHRITKPWWWGDGQHGLFFNPKVNKVPPEFDHESNNDNGCSNGMENGYNDHEIYDDDDNGNNYEQEEQFRNGYPYENVGRNGKNSRNGNKREN